jgi:PAS domain S-box-containing protein
MLVEPADVLLSLDSDQLAPTFQPLVQVRDGKLAGFEVLARWQHPAQGLILPQNFISLAEEHGLIGRLTEQILCKALTAATRMPEAPALSVNISPCQLRDESLPALIRSVAEETHFPLEKLTVEITETALLDNLDQARSMARDLKQMGCRLSLDDFGTGYSSLHHLRALPFDELKIDRSFVASMSDARESRKIVAAVVGLGHSLGLSTVGEGVETERHAEMLLWLGCDVVQGWLYGRPLPAEALPAMIGAPPRLPSRAALARALDPSHASLEAMPEQRLAQLEAIYDGVPCYLCFLDRNLRYVSLNRRLAALDGRPVEEHLGRTVKEILPHLFPKIEKYLLSALRGEPTNDVEVFRRAMGHGQRDKTLLASYQPMIDEAGEVTGVLIAMVDITARKRAESALRRREAQSRFLGGFERPVH